MTEINDKLLHAAEEAYNILYAFPVDFSNGVTEDGVDEGTVTGTQWLNEVLYRLGVAIRDSGGRVEGSLVCPRALTDTGDDQEPPAEVADLLDEMCPTAHAHTATSYDAGGIENPPGETVYCLDCGMPVGDVTQSDQIGF